MFRRANPPQRRARLQRPHRYYTHIKNPEFGEALSAAFIWDEIAEAEDLEYAFVGSFAARLNAINNEFLVHDLEILVDPAVLANYCQRLTDIMHRNPNRMAFTRSNRGASRHIIVIDEYAGRGIAVQFFATGTLEFPDPLVAPRESHFRTRENIDMVETYRYQDAADQYQLRSLPILRFHLLLYQRLTRFDVNSTDQDIAARNYRDIDAIVVFLLCTSNPNFGDSPLPPAMANSLLNNVRAWVRYAGISNHPTTPEELQMWRNLGVALTNADFWAQYYY
jgi:hypothetical protein